jgi:Na+/H+ antiporter NhaC
MGLLVFYTAALVCILICVVLNVFLFLKINAAMHGRKNYGFFIQRFFIHDKESGRDGDLLHFFPISIIIDLLKKSSHQTTEIKQLFKSKYLVEIWFWLTVLTVIMFNTLGLTEL